MAAESPGRTPLRAWLIEWFAAANLAFLALDVYLAHSVNAFRAGAEWIPVVFSAAAPLALLPGLVRRAHGAGFARAAGFVVGGTSVVVGVLGMVLHLHSGFFEERTLQGLVYSAPFLAPLAYAGVGLLLLLNRLEDPESPVWALWVVALALGGFVGNLGLSLLDHAQNGFFHLSEWIPVGAAAFGVAFLAVALVRPGPAFARVCLGVLVLEAAVGVVGAALHLAADLARPGATFYDRVLYGAPVFAPLLFCNLALLAAIGLWPRSR